MSDAPGRNLPAFGRAMRPLFLLDPEVAYLNHGAYGAPPAEVIEASDAVRRRMEREPSAFMVREYQPGLRRVATQLAELLNARPENVALVENATMGVNAVLRGLDLAPGDEILVTDQTYRAVRHAALYVAGRAGAKVAEAKLPFPAHDPDAVLRALESGLGPRTRLAIFDHITSPTALLLPIAEMVRMAKAAGALVLVDGAHAPGMVDIDLARLGADWYTGNCHKWLMAAKGAGFLWAADAIIAGTHPLAISHGYGQGYAAEFDWVGTRDALGQFSLPAALAFRARFGEAAIRDYNHALVMRASEMLAASWDTEVGAAEALTGAMRCVRLPAGFEASDEAAQTLRWRLADHYKVQVPIRCLDGALWARLSAQVYNEIGDYERLGEAVLSIGNAG
jgi:isopenicillin-N epimerase